MSLHRRRRIFRATRPGPVRFVPIRPVLAGIAGLAVIGAVAGLASFGASSVRHGAPPQAARTVSAPAGDVAAVAGDTLVLGRIAVQLRGVESPARGTACRSGTASVDCGAAATAALAGFVRGQAVACRLQGRDAAGRPLGDCTAHDPAGGTLDLGRAMVVAGWARPVGGAAALLPEEAAARTARRGLWAAE